MPKLARTCTAFLRSRMSTWPSTRARRVLRTLLRIGWRIEGQDGSHRVLSRSGWSDFVFAFHDAEEIGPRCSPGSPSVQASARRLLAGVPSRSPPDQGLEPTPYSLRFAPASGRGSPPAFGSESSEENIIRKLRGAPRQGDHRTKEEAAMSDYAQAINQQDRQAEPSAKILTVVAGGGQGFAALTRTTWRRLMSTTAAGGRPRGSWRTSLGCAGHGCARCRQWALGTGAHPRRRVWLPGHRPRSHGGSRRAAEMLTARVGLHERVTFRQGNPLTCPWWRPPSMRCGRRMC